MKRLILILGLLTSFAYAQSKAGFYVVGGKVITVQDTSSQKYLKAVENAGVVTSITQNFASNFLVTTERAIGSYSLIAAQYPIIGGTAATHKFNLNDPRDLDAAFRLVFNGTVTHSALGMQGDGTSGYANTFVNQNFNTNYNIAYGVYSTVDINNLNNQFNVDMGVRLNNSTNNQETSLYVKLSPNVGYGIGNFSYTLLSDANHQVLIDFTNRASKGFFMGSNTSGNTFLLANNTINRTYAAITQTTIAKPFYIGCLNSNTAQSFSNRAYGFAFVSKDLTEAIAIQQSQIVTFFNSIQGRQ